jgi:hypothetical protein
MCFAQCDVRRSTLRLTGPHTAQTSMASSHTISRQMGRRERNSPGGKGPGVAGDCPIPSFSHGGRGRDPTRGSHLCRRATGSPTGMPRSPEGPAAAGPSSE